MLSREFETCLNQAFQRARRARHELLSVEHLLLAILEAAKVREVLEGGGADLELLTAGLQQHAKANTLPLLPGEERPVQPTLGLQRVPQRAAFAVQSQGGSEVGVLNVLAALFTEKHSHAVVLLGRMGATRLVVVTYLAGLKAPR